MTDRRLTALAGLALTVCLPFAGALEAGPKRPSKKPPAGVVVEEVVKDSAAEKAGLQEGDVILAWRRPAAPPANPNAAEGSLDSPFEFFDMLLEQMPRGPLVLAGMREGQALAWALPTGQWSGGRLRPVLPPALLALHMEAWEMAKAKKLMDGAAGWRAAALSAGSDRSVAVWFQSKAAATLADAREWGAGDAVYGEAISVAERGGQPAVAARLLRDWAEVFRRRNEWDRAEDCYRRAIEQSSRLEAESLILAASFNNLGVVKFDRGDLEGADELHRRSLAIREKLAPGSMPVTDSLDNLGNLAFYRGDLATAERRFLDSLSITERLAPTSVEVSGTLNNLGVVARTRGDLAAAEKYYRRALSIAGGPDAAGPDAAARLTNNLGLVAETRGDLAAADSYYRSALAIHERLAPDGIAVAQVLSNLGTVAWNRGDLTTAADYISRALAIKEKLAPASLEVATELNNLGALAAERRDFALSDQYLRRSLEIRERLAPNSLDVASSLRNLSDAAWVRADHARAEAYLERALTIQSGLAPEGLDVADSLDRLSKAARTRGDLARAEDLAGRGLAIRRRLAPGSAAEADSLHELGLVFRAGARAKAAEALCLAVDALEIQKTKLGGTEEARTAFGAKYTDYYRDCLEALVNKGDSAAAFGILERSRARSLLSMLAERDLVFSADVPAELDRERKLANADYDRAQDELAQLSPAKEAEQIEKLHGRLREVRAKQDEIAVSIRKASPRFASLQYPEPLGLDAARAALQPGTLLLSYSVGKEHTILFVVQPSDPSNVKDAGLTVLTLPIGEKDLRNKVEAFRGAIQSRGATAPKLLTTQAAELYDLLIVPAERWVAASDRLLVSPDGPLHTLPFGALVRREARPWKAGATSYLVEWKPLHHVISATVYAELTRSPREGASGPASLVAFGDPKYPADLKQEADKVADATLRSVARGGFGFEPLPSSRAEVEGIQRLYPQEASVYLGEVATEERVKSTGKNVRYLHFATHGLLNERFPLDSALVLTIPEHPAEGQDNGLLQAWEIFEKLRIDADLVTLSACETGLGKEIGGEGLVGLTRAFQYAGARSVLASLWSVSDESTAELMRRFYTYLKAGRTKDEALRDAQVDLIHGATASHPFHWAAFQLVGDWR